MIIPLIRGGRSLGGHHLAGERLLRFVYVDEAGISAHEPVAVVAGVIVNADKDWKQLEDYLLDVRDAYIPLKNREGFVFHAKDISAGNKLYADPEVWPKERRQDFIKEVLYARPLLGFSVSIGIARMQPHHNGASHALIRHLLAYSACVAGCEQYMREFGEDGEIAMIIAEDTPSAKSHIKKVHSDLVSRSPEYPAFREILPVRHIVDTVHFAGKDQSPLLQFADACAFAFRRYLAGYSESEAYVEALVGPLGSLADFPADQSDGYKILASVSPQGLAATGGSRGPN